MDKHHSTHYLIAAGLAGAIGLAWVRTPPPVDAAWPPISSSHASGIATAAKMIVGDDPIGVYCIDIQCGTIATAFAKAFLNAGLNVRRARPQMSPPYIVIGGPDATARAALAKAIDDNYTLKVAIDPKPREFYVSFGEPPE